MSEASITPDESRARAQLLRDEAAGAPAFQTVRLERLLRAADRFERLARRLEWDLARRTAGASA